MIKRGIMAMLLAAVVLFTASCGNDYAISVGDNYYELKETYADNAVGVGSVFYCIYTIEDLTYFCVIADDNETISGVAVFNQNRECIYSRGLKVMNGEKTDFFKEGAKYRQMVLRYGEPLELASGIDAWGYLTSDGYVIYAAFYGEGGYYSNEFQAEYVRFIDIYTGEYIEQ